MLANVLIENLCLKHLVGNKLNISDQKYRLISKHSLIHQFLDKHMKTRIFCSFLRISKNLTSFNYAIHPSKERNTDLFNPRTNKFLYVKNYTLTSKFLVAGVL